MGENGGFSRYCLLEIEKDEKDTFRLRKDFKKMCQAAPGPRCYYDTSKVLRTRQGKIDATRVKLTAASSSLEKAMQKSDFSAYSRHKQTVEKLSLHLKDLITTRRYDRRDAYGTKTGAKKLALRIKNAPTDIEAEQLRKLAVQAEALRFSREHALAMKKAGYVPAIRWKKVAA